MWQIVNRTPFEAGQGWIRDRNGAEVWLVAVKATFDVLPDGSTEVSKLQPPVLRVPEHYGEPGKSSIKYESDFVLTKKTTDIIFSGHAYAPNARPVRELAIRFQVGPVDKSLRVFGDRKWGGFGLSDPQPFVKMPIIYERAYGGVDTKSENPERDWEWRNPIGTGYSAKKGHTTDLRLPNIEHPGELIGSWKDRPAPAGFGPIASHWQPRASFAGTYDGKWESTRQPLLPEDFDDRFFQCAPPDQQSPQFLKGGEHVVLLNLSQSARIEFLLPNFSLELKTHFMDGERRVHAAPRLHTVILEPDFPRVSLVWHSAIECHSKVYQLENTRIEWRTDAMDEDADESVESLLDLI